VSAIEIINNSEFKQNPVKLCLNEKKKSSTAPLPSMNVKAIDDLMEELIADQ
jgi:hypothetical protein